MAWNTTSVGVTRAARQLVERHLGALAWAYWVLPAVVVRRHLQTRHVERGGVHPAGRDGDHAARRRLLELVEQQRREQERAEHLRRHGGLDSRRVGAARRRERAGVVDDDVDAARQSSDLAGKRADLAELTHVGGNRDDVGTARRGGDLGRRPLGPRLVAAGDDDPSPERCEAQGSLTPRPDVAPVTTTVRPTMT